MSASAPTARFPRRPTRGVMLGLSGLRLASVSLAVVILLFWLLTLGGALGFGVGVLLAAPLVVSSFVTIGGRTAVEWAPLVAQWEARNLTGQNLVAGQAVEAATSRDPRPPRGRGLAPLLR